MPPIKNGFGNKIYNNMKIIKNFSQFEVNEGIFDPIRKLRFKDDEVVQNLLKIIKKN